MSSTAVLQAVRRISQGVAMLPTILYRRDGQGKMRATDSALYRILHDSPNPEITAYEFKEWLQASCLIRGTAFAEIVRNRYGEPIELWPLRSDRMTVKRLDSGSIVYAYSSNGQIYPLRPEQVFHLRGFAYYGLIGLCIPDTCRESLGVTQAQEEYQARYFANDASPGGILEAPGILTDEAHKRMKVSWESMHSGLDNKHRIAILEDGTQYKQVGLSAKDAQLIEGRTFQVQEVARMFDIPPHMLMELSRATFTNIEHQGLEYVTYTLGPWLKRWEQRIHKHLIGPRDQQEYFAEFLVDALMRGDAASRASFYRTLFYTGSLSANEIRSFENWNPLPPEIGDVYMVQSNMTPTKKAGLALMPVAGGDN